MKRNLLLLFVAALLLVVVTIFVDDGWIYPVAALIATTIVVVVRGFHSTSLKITRWAKANPKKTQVLIGILQILVVCGALFIGYDLKKLGYQLNETTTIVFGVILVSAFFSIRFLPKQNVIAIPAAVNRDRMAYMSIILSAIVILVVTGNRIEDKFPNSPISIALRSVDQSIFGDDYLNEEKTGFELNRDQTILVNERSPMLAFASITGVDESSVAPEIHPKKEAREKIKAEKKAQKLEKKKQRMMKRIEKLRKLVGAAATVGMVLLVILLVITTCAGICLIAIGGSAGAVILGVFLLAGSIFGWVKIFEKKKKVKEA